MSASGAQTSRRALLSAAAALAPIAALAGAAASAQVLPASDDPRKSAPAPAHPAVDDYVPAFFTPVEWAFVNAACDRLIPKDEHGPGAVELGVPQYIDRQMGTPWADGAIWYMQGPFFEAKPEFGYQSKLTPSWQSASIALIPSRYWTMIAYPGVRADFLEWVSEAKRYPYGPVSIYGQRG